MHTLKEKLFKIMTRRVKLTILLIYLLNGRGTVLFTWQVGTRLGSTRLDENGD